ncbi:uncharacterized protein LOC111388650 isoform X2 [Olea europaea var. sylvestris]|uniref:uncharacterized protein LOC111388650 isoform X2 n=1 Tax=Olea europaea var. sylvestris TaxID=158386 RepID=UPI000C1D0919|nr:uncharacterized protein LOC111388650 isoform X2 [Olea europaea var. sylvestris]
MTDEQQNLNRETPAVFNFLFLVVASPINSRFSFFPIKDWQTVHQHQFPRMKRKLCIFCFLGQTVAKEEERGATLTSSKTF